MRNPTTSSAITRAVLAGIAAVAVLIAGGVDARADGVGIARGGTGGTGGAPLGPPQVPTYTKVICTPEQVYTGQPMTPCTATTTAPDGTVLASPPIIYSNNVFATSGTSTAMYTAGYLDPSGQYRESSATGTFDIARAPATTMLSCPLSVPYTGSLVTPCSATIVAGATTTSVDVRYTNNIGPGTATAAPDLKFYTDPNYYIALSQQAFFTIGTATTVTVSCATGSTYTGAALTPCTATATAADGFRADVPVTYGNNTNAGTATASTTYAGDGTGGHLGSSGSTTFTIAKAPSSVTVSCPVSVTYTGAPLTPCSATATGVGTLSGATSTGYSNNTDAGQASVTVTSPGDANHNPSTGTGTFTIDKAPSAVTVTCPTSADFTGAPLSPCTATVTGAGGLATTATVSYSNNVYTGTATATGSYAGDANHLPGTGTASFQVRGFSFTGYYSPVTMGTAGSPAWNTIKAGSTVPLKFEAFLPNGAKITSTPVLGATFTTTQVACPTATATATANQPSTDATGLRYDPTGGQFIQNWKTPKGATGCYQATTTTADHSQLTAYFILR